MQAYVVNLVLLLTREFQRQHLAMVDAGEPFRLNDVVMPDDPPPRQFLRALVFADRTIVWYYHGGFVEHPHIIELRMLQETFEKVPSLHLTGRNLIGPSCEATEALLRGVEGGRDW